VRCRESDVFLSRPAWEASFAETGADGYPRLVGACADHTLVVGCGRSDSPGTDLRCSARKTRTLGRHPGVASIRDVNEHCDGNPLVRLVVGAGSVIAGR